jgi:hypothetical protein
MRKQTIGMDLGDRTSRYCILNEEGDIVFEGSVPTTKSGMNQVFGAMPRCPRLNGIVESEKTLFHRSFCCCMVGACASRHAPKTRQRIVFRMAGVYRHSHAKIMEVRLKVILGILATGGVRLLFWVAGVVGLLRSHQHRARVDAVRFEAVWQRDL